MENFQMPPDQEAIIKQIDDILASSTNVSGPENLSKTLNMMFAAIYRLAPPGSVYVNTAKRYESDLTTPVTLSTAFRPVRGILQALRHDYESGYLQSVTELVHADIFADFLEMADYLLQEGYKDPAAVVSGSVLEAHLRKLCDKHGIAPVKPDGTPKTADALNSELAAATVYSKLDQKSVTAWLDLRNKAAPGKYSGYADEQVRAVLLGVRDFASRYPA